MDRNRERNHVVAPFLPSLLFANFNVRFFPIFN